MRTYKSPTNRPTPSTALGTAQRAAQGTAPSTALGTAPSTAQGTAQRSISSSCVKARCARSQHLLDKGLTPSGMSARARTWSGFELILACHVHGFAWPCFALRRIDPCPPKAAGMPTGIIDAGSDKSASIMITSNEPCNRSQNRAGVITRILIGIRTSLNLYQCLRRHDARAASGGSAKSCGERHSGAKCNQLTKGYKMCHQIGSWQGWSEFSAKAGGYNSRGNANAEGAIFNGRHVRCTISLLSLMVVKVACRRPSSLKKCPGWISTDGFVVLLAKEPCPCL